MNQKQIENNNTSLNSHERRMIIIIYLRFMKIENYKIFMNIEQK